MSKSKSLGCKYRSFNEVKKDSSKEHSMGRRMGVCPLYLLAFALLLGVVLGVTRPAQAATADVRINVGETQQVYLGASITTGKLTSGDWDSSNKSVAKITSESPSFCNVTGVSAGTATISCKYKYYIAGTTITSYWHCKVEVVDTGSGIGGSGSGYKTLTCDTTSLTLDLAKPSVKGYLDFAIPGVSDSDYYVSIDARNGYLSTVNYNSFTYSENGNPVFLNMACTLTPRRVGSESIVFELVRKTVDKDGYGRYYNTSHGTVTVDVNVMCSHKFGEGEIIQEGTESQSTIIEYTCSACGEKKTEEKEPASGKTEPTSEKEEPSSPTKTDTATVCLSESSVELAVGESREITINAEGTLPSRYTVLLSKDGSGYKALSRGLSFARKSRLLTITGTAEGSGTITVSLEDVSTGKVFASAKVSVTVVPKAGKTSKTWSITPSRPRPAL